MKKLPIIIILLLLISLSFFYFSHNKDTSNKTIELTINNQTFILDKAITTQEKAKGLMFRKSLPENKGMIFIFDEEAERTFWMKNTLVPLDIIFLDKTKKIIDIKENVQPCTNDPCETYTAIARAQYVIEVKGKTAGKIGLKKGDIIQINNL